MNKQELIASYERVVNFSETVPIKNVIEKLKQLDEPQPVKIPPFAAEHIEWAKEEDFHLLGAMSRENFDKKLEDWFYTGDNMELFARAWLDGYEVEKEKKYKIVMLNIASSGGVLTRIKHDDSWIWIDTLGTIVEGRTHTRKELEDAGFGWVFDCPGLEVEEVTE